MTGRGLCETLRSAEFCDALLEIGDDFGRILSEGLLLGRARYFLPAFRAVWIRRQERAIGDTQGAFRIAEQFASTGLCLAGRIIQKDCKVLLADGNPGMAPDKVRCLPHIIRLSVAPRSAGSRVTGCQKFTIVMYRISSWANSTPEVMVDRPARPGRSWTKVITSSGRACPRAAFNAGASSSISSASNTSRSARCSEERP